jgi:hypothetical protein
MAMGWERDAVPEVPGAREMVEEGCVTCERAPMCWDVKLGVGVEG